MSGEQKQNNTAEKCFKIIELDNLNGITMTWVKDCENNPKVYYEDIHGTWIYTCKV